MHGRCQGHGVSRLPSLSLSLACRPNGSSRHTQRQQFGNLDAVSRELRDLLLALCCTYYDKSCVPGDEDQVVIDICHGDDLPQLTIPVRAVFCIRYISFSVDGNGQITTADCESSPQRLT